MVSPQGKCQLLPKPQVTKESQLYGSEKVQSRFLLHLWLYLVLMSVLKLYRGRAALNKITFFLGFDLNTYDI